MSFNQLKNDQKLTVEFEAFIGLLIRLFTSMIKEPQTHFATLSIQPNFKASLIFEQNLQYRVIELLALELNMTNEDGTKDSVSYRYNFVKSKLELVQSRFTKFVKVVKVKNPSLVAQLEKSIKTEQIINKKVKSGNI